MSVYGGPLSGRGRQSLTRADVEERLRQAGSSENLMLAGEDMSDSDLSYIDLRGADIRRADLSEANLGFANLGSANLRGADLSRANLSGADLRKANLEGANLEEANLEGSNLEGANLSRANLSEVSLSEANLSRTDLSRAKLNGSRLSKEASELVSDAHQILERTFKRVGYNIRIYRAYSHFLSQKSPNFSKANLVASDLREADLRGANLEDAKLGGVDLRGANLSIANLSRANLSKGNLEGANLSMANLEGANLSMANLEGANLENIIGRPIGLRESEKSEKEERGREFGPALRLRIKEEPLTIQHLSATLDAFTSLYTKMWLLQQGRFDDFVHYTEYKDRRFEEEAHITIAELKYNSPLNIEIPVPKALFQALQTLLDTVLHPGLRKQAIEADNQSKQLDNQLKEQEVIKERLNNADHTFETMQRASAMIEKLYPGLDAEKKAIVLQSLIKDILQLVGDQTLEISLLLPAPDPQQQNSHVQGQNISIQASEKTVATRNTATSGPTA